MKFNRFLVSIFAVVLLVYSCTQNEDRRIKLASRPVDALMHEQVETIKLEIAKKKKVAILYFDNKTGEDSLNWLEQGIVAMLSNDLSQSRQLDLLPTKRTVEVINALDLSASQLSDEHKVLQIVKELGAEVYVLGSYYKDNDSLKVDVEIYDAKDGALLSHVTETSKSLDTFLPLVDRVSLEMRTYLEIKYDETLEVDKRLADVTTSSITAYEQYAKGIEHTAKLYDNEAEKYFAKAIEIDSSFASAYAELALIEMKKMKLDEARKYLDKAVKFSENMPEKERLKILALASIARGNVYEAGQHYLQITELYPEDAEAHYELGNFYFSGHRDFYKAVEQYELALALNPDYKLALNQLGYAYADIGELENAYDALQRYIQLAKDEPNPYDSFGDVLQRQGEIEKAIVEYKKALKINKNFNPSKLHLVSAYIDLGKSNKAFKLAKKIFKRSKDSSDKVRALHLMASAKISQNEKSDAIEYLKKAYRLQPYTSVSLYNLSLIDPKLDFLRSQFSDWVEHEKKLSIEGNVKFENIFDLIVLSFITDYKRDDVEQLLEQFINDTHDPILAQSAVAFKIIMEYNKGLVNDKTQKIFSQINDPNAFNMIGTPAWDTYWRFWAEAIIKAFQNKTLHSDNDIYGLRRFAKNSDNLHFFVASTFGAALLEKLKGDAKNAEQQMLSVGAPCEEIWRFTGPFEINRGVHQKFWPEEKKVVEWLEDTEYRDKIRNSNDGLLDGYIDFKKCVEFSFNNCGYAFLQINSPELITCQMRFGSNGMLKAWLNDIPILIKNERKLAVIDDFIVPIRLRPGPNWLMVRINQRVGEAGFYFRITDSNGYGVSDISFGNLVSS